MISLKELLMYSFVEAVLLFAFQYDHEICSFKLYKNCAEILMRIELNLYIAFSRMAITSVNSSKPWQGVLHILISLLSFVNDLKILSHWTYTPLVRNTI